MDNAGQDAENSILGFKALLKLDVLVPEWMRQEVKANTIGASFEQSRFCLSVVVTQAEGRAGEVERGSKHI